MRKTLLLFFLLFGLHVFSQDPLLEKRIVSIENDIYSGHLKDASANVQVLSKSTDRYYQQMSNLYQAKIAFHKGDLQKMNSKLKNLSDEFPKVKYYKSALYGQYLISNNQVSLGYKKLAKTLEIGDEIEDDRVNIYNQIMQLSILSHTKKRQRNILKNNLTDKAAKKIITELNKNTVKLQPFERILVYQYTKDFIPRKDKKARTELGQTILDFGNNNNYTSSKIMGQILLSEQEVSATKRAKHLFSALKEVDQSDLFILNSDLYEHLSDHYEKLGNIDSAIYWAKKSIFPEFKELSIYLDPYDKLSFLYEKKGDLDSALYYSQIDLTKHKSISNKQTKNVQEYFVTGLEKNLNEKNLLLERNRVLIISISIFTALLLGLLFYTVFLSRKLKSALVEVKQSNAEFEVFSRILSHDLKAPIHTISNLVGYVVEDEKDLDFKSKSYLMAAKDACENSNQLISNIMTFIRFKDREMTISPTSLEKVLASVHLSLKEQISTNDAEILGIDLPSKVDVNPILITQLLQNLIQNSIKYKDLDRNPIIIVSYRPLDKGFEISVQDNGIGIPNEKTETIIEAFEQDFFTSIDNGIGLGLAICSSIVKLHKGRMKIENNSTEGITVRMTFFTEK